MSLIEQAAKRLEALRRSGIGASDAAQAPQEPTLPTPEAIVRALEAQQEARVQAVPSIERATAAAPAAPAAVAPLRRPAADASGALAAHAPAAEGVVHRPRTTLRKVEIDLNRLRARGFVTPDAPTSQIADEFRVIKRPILRNAQGRDGARVKNGNLVLVTSALPAEGKTFCALNLAMSIAMEYDHHVLLVDGDVGNAGLPSLVGSPEAPGLLDLLTSDSLDVADALVRTNVDKLTLLPAGTRNRRSTELLASEQMNALLRELATRYADRIVIFDSPPLLRTTEARVLATHMGQIIMVVAAESTSQSTVDQALATLESCEIVLMTLNKADPGHGSRYDYYPADASR